MKVQSRSEFKEVRGETMSKEQIIKYKYAEEKKIIPLPNDDIIILDVSSPNWLKTSITGKYLLEEMKEPKTIDELTAKISQVYGLPIDVVKPIIRETVEKFYETGVVIRIDKDNKFTSREKQKIESLGLQQIWINVTYACNLNCSHCFARMKGDTGFIPANDLIRIFKEAQSLGVQEIVISGGEPTLHPELENILREARKIGDWKIKLITNGYLSGNPENERKIKSLCNYVDDIQVSFDGIKPETHDAIRGKGSFEKAYRFMFLLSEVESIKTGISFTPLPKNINEIPKLFNFAIQVKATYIHLNRPKYPLNTLAFPSLDLFMSQQFAEEAFTAYDKLVQEFYKSFEDMRNLNVRLPIIDTSFDPASELLSPLKKERCSAGILTIAIDPKGDVFPCAALMRREMLYFGNVFEEGLEKIYKRGRDKMIELFSVEKNDKCKECLFRYFCGGGCRATAKDLKECDYLCDIFQKRFIDFWKRISLPVIRTYANKIYETREGGIKRLTC